MARLEVEILTLFPRMCEGYLAESILGKARESGLVEVRVTDIREHAAGRHRVADDAPYGGGAGMVMKPEPVFKAHSPEVVYHFAAYAAEALSPFIRTYNYSNNLLATNFGAGFQF